MNTTFLRVPSLVSNFLFGASILLVKSTRFFYFFFFSPSATSKDDMEVHASASPDVSGIRCCEVCGKYGLPQDFLASGRFCSLTCVGVYTGRRNKGREYVRHAKTVDGKIVKRKKKDKGKKIVLPTKRADHVNIAYYFFLSA